MNNLISFENMTSEQITVLQEQLNIARFKSIETKLEEIGANINRQDNSIAQINNNLVEFVNDMPLLGVEIEKITSAVKTKGVECLGGKKSYAYADKSLRGRVYADIYAQLKREFGVSTYKAIKRNQAGIAIGIIDDYALPTALIDAIEGANGQIGGLLDGQACFGNRH